MSESTFLSEDDIEGLRANGALPEALVATFRLLEENQENQKALFLRTRILFELGLIGAARKSCRELLEVSSGNESITRLAERLGVGAGRTQVEQVLADAEFDDF